MKKAFDVFMNYRGNLEPDKIKEGKFWTRRFCGFLVNPRKRTAFFLEGNQTPCDSEAVDKTLDESCLEQMKQYYGLETVSLKDLIPCGFFMNIKKDEYEYFHNYVIFKDVEVSELREKTGKEIIEAPIDQIIKECIDSPQAEDLYHSFLETLLYIKSLIFKIEEKDKVEFDKEILNLLHLIQTDDKKSVKKQIAEYLDEDLQLEEEVL